MRKTVPVYFALGGFLLVAGLVALIWAPGLAERTPLSTDSLTHLGGTASILDPTTGQTHQNKVAALSVNQVDSNASDGSVAAWTSSSCLLIDNGSLPKDKCVSGTDKRLVTAGTDVFATDRHSAESVNSGKYLPASAKAHRGLINKFPFDAQKKTYPYWNDMLGKALPATYIGTATVHGVSTYLYRSTVKDAPIDIAAGVPGTYDDETSTYVEPRTGAILNQVDSQQRFLADGTPVLDLKLAFTDAQQKADADKAKTNKLSLTLVTTVVPVVGIVGGLVLLLFGFRGARQGLGRSSASGAKREPLPAGA